MNRVIKHETVTYYSTDYATHNGLNQTHENIYLNFPIEMLNNISVGLPPHEIKLKKKMQLLC